MSAQAELAAARDDMMRTRARMAETRAEIDARLSSTIDSVKAKLDVVQLVRDNPWPALGAALVVGTLISASGADSKAAAAAAAAARQAAEATADAAKQAGAAAIDSVKRSPDTAQAVWGGIGRQLDSIAGSLALSFIDSLRKGGIDERST